MHPLSSQLRSTNITTSLIICPLKKKTATFTQPPQQDEIINTAIQAKASLFCNLFSKFG